MNIDEIKDVAREFGWREVGEYADLSRWLRLKLQAGERAESERERLQKANDKLRAESGLLTEREMGRV